MARRAASFWLAVVGAENATALATTKVNPFSPQWQLTALELEAGRRAPKTKTALLVVGIKKTAGRQDYTMTIGCVTGGATLGLDWLI